MALAGRRRDEILRIAVALALLLLTAPIVVRAGSVGWAEEGVLFTVADTVTVVLPGNLDVPVAVVAGVVAGWSVLFAIDVTKRIQTIILVPVVTLVLVVLDRQNNVVDAVGREPLWFLIVATVTAAGTAYTAKHVYVPRKYDTRPARARLRIVHFPAASRGLFFVLSVAIAAITVEYPLVSHTTGDPATPVVLFSGITAILTLGVFVQVTSRTEVVPLTSQQSGSEMELYIFGGLFARALDYRGHPVDSHSGDILYTAMDPPPNREPSFWGRVGFRYLPPQLLRRSVEVNSANSYRLEQLMRDPDWPEYETTLSLRARRIPRAIVRRVTRLVPFSSTSKLDRVENVQGAVRSADVVLLAVPFPVDEADETLQSAAALLRTIERDTPARGLLILTHVDRSEHYEFGAGDPNEVIRPLIIELTERFPDDADDAETAWNKVKQSDTDRVYPLAKGPMGETCGFDRLLEEMSE